MGVCSRHEELIFINRSTNLEPQDGLAFHRLLALSRCTKSPNNLNRPNDLYKQLEQMRNEAERAHTSYRAALADKLRLEGERKVMSFSSLCSAYAEWLDAQQRHDLHQRYVNELSKRVADFIEQICASKGWSIEEQPNSVTGRLEETIEGKNRVIAAKCMTTTELGRRVQRLWTTNKRESSKQSESTDFERLREAVDAEAAQCQARMAEELKEERTKTAHLYTRNLELEQQVVNAERRHGRMTELVKTKDCKINKQVTRIAGLELSSASPQYSERSTSIPSR